MDQVSSKQNRRCSLHQPPLLDNHRPSRESSGPPAGREVDKSAVENPVELLYSLHPVDPLYSYIALRHGFCRGSTALQVISSSTSLQLYIALQSTSLYITPLVRSCAPISNTLLHTDPHPHSDHTLCPAHPLSRRVCSMNLVWIERNRGR